MTKRHYRLLRLAMAMQAKTEKDYKLFMKQCEDLWREENSTEPPKQK